MIVVLLVLLVILMAALPLSQPGLDVVLPGQTHTGPAPAAPTRDDPAASDRSHAPLTLAA